MGTLSPRRVFGVSRVPSAGPEPEETEESGGWLEEDEEPFIPIDICTAASLGDLESVKHLITRGTDPNDRNHGGWTPLMYAAYIGHDRLCRFMLDSGAKIETPNRRGRTALMLAASCGNDHTVRLFLEYRVDPYSKDSQGWNVLFYAASGNHTNVAAVLLAAGMDCNQPDQSRLQLTPFHMACAQGHDRLVELFLQYGADLSLKTGAGDTARSLAVVNRRDRTVALLDSHRQHPSRKDSLSLQEELSQHKLTVPMRAMPSTAGKSASKASAAVSPMLPTATATSRIMETREEDGQMETLAEFLGELGLGKYVSMLEEQGLDLPLLLQLSDQDLKQAGIKLLGPRKKMTNAIARWHSNAPLTATREAECVYAEYQRAKSEEASRRLAQLEAELQEAHELLESQTDVIRGLQEETNLLKSFVFTAATLAKNNKAVVKELKDSCLTPPTERALTQILNNSDQIILKAVETGLVFKF